MLSELKTPKILFLYGVFKRDCLTDDLLEKQMIEKIDFQEHVSPSGESVGENAMVYKKLPSVFETPADWPKSTNLICWHCSLSFDQRPVFIPRAIEPIISKVKAGAYSMGVFGVFCSFTDALKYIKTSNWSLAEKVEAVNKLNVLHRVFYAKPLEEPLTHIPVHDMVQYGGDTEIAHYRSLTSLFEHGAEQKK